jgi:subtilisin family serine protease
MEPTGLIVKFKSNYSPKAINQNEGSVKTGIRSIDLLNMKYSIKHVSPLLPKRHVSSSRRVFENVFIFLLREGSDAQALAEEYRALPGVEYAEPDYPVTLFDTPNDPMYQHQWNLHNTGQEHYHIIRNWGINNDELVLTGGVDDADIDAGDVYENPPDNTTTVVVAIIDTGVDMDHPDLADNIWTNPREIPDNDIDDDNNGYVDDVHGWDFASNMDPSAQGDNDPTDEYGHGTHCAGIVAAIAGNSTGIAGVAPDVRIMPLKFDPLPLVSRIAGALIYAADNGADVVNMSFGLIFRSDLIEEAINYARDKGVIHCAAIGNSGIDEFVFPAGYDATIAVGATNDSDRVTSFSSYGDHMSVCAPGRSILSLRADNTDMYSGDREPGVHIIDTIYYLASGTSMACPHVVGAAAYLRSVSPGLTADKVQEIIETSADDIIDPFGLAWNLPGKDIYSGYGRLNLRNALEIAPKIRAKIVYPAPNDILSGDVLIHGLADGEDFSEYVVEYGEGSNPSSWMQICQSHSPVTGDALCMWTTSDLSGQYTIRLRVGDFNVSTVTIYTANKTSVQIISPSEDDIIANHVIVVGDAYAPDFSHLVLEYKMDTNIALEWREIAGMSVPIYGEEIAGWFLDSLTQASYLLRLSVFSNSGLIASDIISVRVRSIFSTEHAWRASLEGYPTIIPNYGDLDDDGANEIIVGMSSGITVLNLDGTLKTEGIPDFPSNNFMIPIAVGNLDGDGIDDMVAVGYDPSFLYGYPSAMPTFESYLGGFPPVSNFYRTEHDFPRVYLKDIDGDEVEEIIVFIYSTSRPRTFIFESDGGLIDSYDYYSEVFPVDMNGDGIDEIYACNRGFCLLRQINYQDGATHDSLLIQLNGSNFNCYGMSAYDIDDDDIYELLVFGYYPDYGYYIYAFDGGLNLVDGWPHEMGIDDFVVPTIPIFGDIDDDNEAEYLTTFYDISSSYVLAWNLDGSPYIPGNSNGLFVRTPEPSLLNMLLLADINGDNRTDIIACADNDVFDTYKAQRIYAWDNEGQLIPGFPLITVPEAFTADRFTPCIGDINADGNVDLIMTTPDSKQIFINYPGCPYNKCKSPAPFWKYNRRMDGVAPLPSECGPTDVADDGRTPNASTYSLAQNYPNPFNPTTRIAYTVPTRSHVSISVYNLLGQEVITLVDELKAAGRYITEWDGTDYNGAKAASGIYLYRIKAGDFVESRKMLLLK